MSGERPWVLWVATAYHLLIGPILVVSPNSAHSTGPSALFSFFGDSMAAGIVTTVVGLVALAILLRNHADDLSGWLLTPQSFLLFIASISALVAIVSGQYPDGVERPSAFILTDQALVLLVTLFHAVAVLEIFGK